MIHIFDKEETDFNGQGKIAVATKNSTTDIDLLVSTEHIINGGIIYCDKSVVGDYFQCQVVDKDGVYAAPGTVLAQWMTNWPVVPSQSVNIKIEQVGQVPAGVYLRVKYTSIGTTDDVKVLIGYRLYKVIP